MWAVSKWGAQSDPRAGSESKESDEDGRSWQWTEDQGPHRPAGAEAVDCDR